MYEKAIKKSVFSYMKNGKLYFNEIDWQTELQLEINAIRDFLFKKIDEDKKSPVYLDEDFREFVNQVLYGKNSAETLLNGDKIKYITQFELALLRFGSYELIDSDESIFKNYTPEQKETLYKHLDGRAADIQTALIDYCENFQYYRNLSYDDYTKNLREIYLNYILSFATQRLSSYTNDENNFNILFDMNKLRELSLKNFELNDIANKLIDFNSLYGLEDIIKLILLNKRMQETNDVENYTLQIDKLTLRAITASGVLPGMLNFANINCTQTLEKLADNIPYRINTFKVSNNEELEEVDILLNNAEQLCNMHKTSGRYPLDLIQSNLLINKILQIARLNIVPDKYQKKLDEFIDKVLQRENINLPDMFIYDEFIDSKKQMPNEMADSFFDNVTMFLLRDGIMPVKYNEYLIAQILDENSYLSQKLNEVQKNIIIENFARIRSESLTGNKNYITYSNDLYNRITANSTAITAGEHMAGFIKLMPKVSEDQMMNIVINIININHELRHEQQHQAIESSTYNHLIYMIAKEKIIRGLDIGFYRRNYDYMYEELDAEYFALKNTLNFLDTLNLSGFKKSEKYLGIRKSIEKRLQETEDRFMLAKVKKGKDGEDFDIEERIDEEIFKNPNLLNESPILRVEYNDDGTKKSVKQIFEEFTIICREKSNRLGNYDLYKYVLLSRVGLGIEECEELVDIDIPQDLSPATKMALDKLRYLLINREIEKMTGESKKIIPGKPIEDNLSSDEVKSLENATEQMTEEMMKKYQHIIKEDNEKQI